MTKYKIAEPTATQANNFAVAAIIKALTASNFPNPAHLSESTIKLNVVMNKLSEILNEISNYDDNRWSDSLKDLIRDTYGIIRNDQ